jgi:hypothetical protein
VWWAVTLLPAATGGRGRVAAVTGAAGMTTALLLSNLVTKQPYRRRRRPSEWVPPDALRDRPESSSFTSGRTAAAFAFAGVVS